MLLRPLIYFFSPSVVTVVFGSERYKTGVETSYKTDILCTRLYCNSARCLPFYMYSVLSKTNLSSRLFSPFSIIGFSPCYVSPVHIIRKDPQRASKKKYTYNVHPPIEEGPKMKKKRKEWPTTLVFACHTDYPVPFVSRAGRAASDGEKVLALSETSTLSPLFWTTPFDSVCGIAFVFLASS